MVVFVGENTNLQSRSFDDVASIHTKEGIWRHSLDPKNEKHMPGHLRSWERWQSHFDEEQAAKLLAFDMGSECRSCGHCAWEIIDTFELKAIQCRSCGHMAQESGSSKSASRNFRGSAVSQTPSFHHGYDESEGSEAEGDSWAEPTTIPEEDEEAPASPTQGASEEEGVTEMDFAALMSPREGRIQSVRQSMAQPPPRRPRWFESEDHITFQFKMTPRGGKGGAGTATAAAAPTANEDGSSGPAASDNANPTISRGGIHELGDDTTAWQRLLTSALFLIKEDKIPMRPGESKVLDLGLASSRSTSGKHLVMKHESSADHEANLAASTDEAKRIRWKIVIKPVVSEKGRGHLLPR